MVWPSPLKFIGDLNPEAALMEANRDREKQTTVVKYCPARSDDEAEELCGICLEQACNIQVRDCGHQMTLQPPAWPFCRGANTGLLVPVAINNKSKKEKEEGSSSFKGLSSLPSPRLGAAPEGSPTKEPQHDHSIVFDIQ